MQCEAGKTEDKGADGHDQRQLKRVRCGQDRTRRGELSAKGEEEERRRGGEEERG